MNKTGIPRILSWATVLSLLVSFGANTNIGRAGQMPVQSRHPTPSDKGKVTRMSDTGIGIAHAGSTFADGTRHGIMLGDSIRLGDGSLCCGDNATAEATSLN